MGDDAARLKSGAYPEANGIEPVLAKSHQAHRSGDVICLLLSMMPVRGRDERDWASVA